MSLFRWTPFIVVCSLWAAAAAAQEARLPDPLFQSDEILEVRIVAPMSTLLSERPDVEELPGTLHFMNAAGQAVDLDIKIRTRGKFRRQREICTFPPLRLNFKKSQTKGTLFHKQDKVKLVTHCRSSSSYEQVLLREYEAYRILNVMTDSSYRVRLMQITYVDSAERRRDIVRHGFIIEHKSRLAKRLGKSVLNIPSTKPDQLEPEFANMISVYHYLIGNTDFSSVLGIAGEDCCHNHVLFGNEGEAIRSIPYDFDQTGLVNAPYAGANPKFKLRSVKQRLYRGRCIHNERLDTTIAMFNEKRDEIMAVIGESGALDKRSTKSIRSYIDKFYDTVNSEKRVEREIVKKCI